MIRWPWFSKTGSLWINERDQIRLIFILIISFLVAGCSKSNSTSTSDPIQTIIPQSPVALTTSISPTETSRPLPSASPTQPTILVWLQPYLPDKLSSGFSLPLGYNLAATPEEANIILDVGEQNAQPTIQWIFTLVAPFPKISDGVTSEMLRSIWEGTSVTPS